MSRRSNHNKNSKDFLNLWLGNYPGRTLHRLGTALVGIWITSSIINFIWPLPDQIGSQRPSIIIKENNGG